jgi:hypothetical protein
MKFWKRWRLIRWTAIAFAAAVVAAPAAQAMHAPVDVGSAPAAKATTVRVVKTGGYGVDWAEVALGSGLGAFFLGGGAVVALRRRRDAALGAS